MKKTNIIEYLLNKEDYYLTRFEESQDTKSSAKYKDAKVRINFLNKLITALMEVLDDNDYLEIDENDNLGVFIEALIKYLLNKGNSKAEAGQTDLSTGGKLFEIKHSVNSYGLCSPVAMDNDKDVILITASDVVIIRAENVEKVLSDNNFAKVNERKLKPKAVTSVHAVKTQFTKRLENMLGL